MANARTTVTAWSVIATGVLLIAASASNATDWPTLGTATTFVRNRCIQQDPYSNGGSCTHYNYCIARNNTDPNLTGVCPGFPNMKRTDFRSYGYCVLDGLENGGSSCDQYTNPVCARITFYENAGCTSMSTCNMWVIINGNACLAPVAVAPPPAD